MGTKISAQLSMVAAPGSFSLFTAYQFLSFGRFVCASESKMRPYPSCVHPWFCAYMMEMIATSFSLLTAYQILSADFYFQEPLTTAWIRVTIQHLQKKEHGAVLCSWLLDFSDHMFIIFTREVDHIWWLAFFFSVPYLFLLCRRSDFWAFLPPESKTTWLSFGTRIWPHLWP